MVSAIPKERNQPHKLKTTKRKERIVSMILKERTKPTHLINLPIRLGRKSRLEVKKKTKRKRIFSNVLKERTKLHIS